MTKRWLAVLGTAVVLCAGGLLVSRAALAQTPTPTPQAQGSATTKGCGQVGPMSEIATLLGMTPDEIWAERVLGKTLADIAKEKGVDTQKLIDALVAGQKTRLDTLVTNSQMTQTQADTYLNWYKQYAALQLTEPYGPGMGGMGMGGGPGRGGHGGGGRGMGALQTQPDASATPGTTQQQ